MFKFLFGGKKPEDAVPETDRERFHRLTTDLNELIDSLAVKPKVTFDPETGRVTYEEPEQFADEALALPAPSSGASAEEAKAAEPQATAAEKISEGDAVASAPKAPVPSPSVSNPSQPRA